MAGLDDYRRYTSTPARRRTFYCYCTKEFVQDQAAFFVLVEAYRVSRRKKQALFLNDWFINGNIPQTLQAGGYLSIVNIAASLQKSTSDATTAAVAAVGKTFADKMANQGGGVGGFFGALGKKISGTGVPADLFDAAQGQVVGMLNDRHGFGAQGGLGATYQMDGSYLPNGIYAGQVAAFKSALTTAGFDPDSLGIY
ncbi:MAG TPA: hypothetical protein VGM87_17585 [Roseomonas sp.]